MKDVKLERTKYSKILCAREKKLTFINLFFKIRELSLVRTKIHER